MAQLPQPTAGGAGPFADRLGDALAPAGTFVATIIDVADEFGVTRTKYQSTETEVVDLTTFLFGFRDAAGAPCMVSSRRMKISGNEKATLYGFLKSILGKAPAYGWDYCELKGAQCLLTVEHVMRNDGSGSFASVAALSPLPAGYGGGQVPPPVAAPAVPAVPTATTPPAAPVVPPAMPTQAQAPVVPAVVPAAPQAPQAAPPSPAPATPQNDDPLPF